MSLVSNFVIMVDGKWYKNASIYDKTNNWFICFDDDDPSELVSYSPKQMPKVDRLNFLKTILLTSDITANIISHQNSGSRLFPPNWTGPFKPTISAYLNIKRRIDLKELEIVHDGVTNEIPTNLYGYVAYDFEKEGHG